MDSQRRIPIPGTYNFRDPGGYAAGAGSIRPGMLFRSDGLHALGEAGKSELRRLGVTTVIDLRDEVEASHMPDDLEGLEVSVLRHPVFEGSGASHGSEHIALAPLYVRIVTQHSHVVVAALREIAGATGGVLVHCTAGKDRTGIVVALALLAVGVDREIVVADYAHTEVNLRGEWLEGMVARLSSFGIADSPELRILMGGSPPDALEAAITHIESEHGSVERYLLDAGLTLDELARLQAKLLSTA